MSVQFAVENARHLITELAAVEERCPLSPRDHRQFVREFIRAVHRVTNNTYSPAIYRRLLAAYAPDRKPSTATLALEKERFVKELVRAPAPIDAAPQHPESSVNLAMEIKQLLGDLAVRLGQPVAPVVDSYLQAQCDFLQQRLSQSEKQLAEARAAAGQMDAQRQVAQAQLLECRGQIESLRASGVAMRAELANMARAVDDARQFALLSIDGVRGETRAWKDRCFAAETQFQSQVSLTETFRRLAYRQGADIPPALEIKRS